MSRVKKFDEFASLDENISFQDVKNFITGAIPSLGQGFTKTLKQKLAAILLEKLGVDEKSNLSVLIQEFVDQIPPTDIPGIISGEKANAEYFAPRMAGFLQEYVQRKGLDTIAQQFGINTTGWIYSILRETFQDQIGKEKLTKFFLNLFGAETTSLGKEAIMSLDPRDRAQFADALSQRAGRSYTKASGIPDRSSSSSKSSFGGLGDFFSGLLQGAKSESN